MLDSDERSPTGHGESKLHYAENEANILDKLVHVLDTLQPAKFHWQRVELRLLLNVQALVIKLKSDNSLVEAIDLLYSDPDKVAASEIENNFIEIILIWLLVCRLTLSSGGSGNGTVLVLVDEGIDSNHNSKGTRIITIEGQVEYSVIIRKCLAVTVSKKTVS
ncbi:hypothetical protein POM88_024651 [Heracleum sosnowskyi]|uniref:Uncharacterized protein n=1 Tax=Heracleum sosnowskyi TaxID=360622 RepID=A0AAD8I4H8_9APIA|nr:hypothetical protein POM88_024651 [Heracleum sosnowskyi]